LPQFSAIYREEMEEILCQPCYEKELKQNKEEEALTKLVENEIKEIETGDNKPQIVDITYNKKTGVSVAIHPLLRGKVEVRVIEFFGKRSIQKYDIKVYDGTEK
jgi:hypothetical protein